MEQISFNTSGLMVGQIFKNFAALFEALTGRKPPQGGNNLKIAKKNLSRYISYEKVPDISKRAVQITEIHNPPLPVKENRGRRGVYIDHLKPLILSSRDFSGKSSEFYKWLGVFGDIYLSDSTTLFKDNSISFSNLLQPNKLDVYNRNILNYSGVRLYVSLLNYNMESALTRALDSLQNDELLEWSQNYHLIPDIFIPIDDTSQYRFKTDKELTKPTEFFRDLSFDDPNITLDPNELQLLNIYSDKWSNLCSLNEYKFMCQREDAKVVHSVPIKASSEQSSVIDDFKKFVWQYTWRKYNNTDSYTSFSELPQIWKCIERPALYKLFFQEYSQLMSSLFNCKYIWKEIEFHVFDPQILSSDSIECHITALEKTFVNYMDKKLETQKFYPLTGEDKDIAGICKAGFIEKTHPQYPLKKSKSAMELHRMLREQTN